MKNIASASPQTGDWASALYPTWLLAEPMRLDVIQQCPHYQGRLNLLSGPQRLEAGWWPVPPDGARHAGLSQAREQSPDVNSPADAPTHGGAALRDYFVARSANSALLWIYRERLTGANPAQSSPGWFLHGIFA